MPKRIRAFVQIAHPKVRQNGCGVLWTPSPDADEHLAAEGVPPEKITRVGNIMIDSYELMRERIDAGGERRRLGLENRTYAVVTLHRPSNVDAAEPLTALVTQLAAIAARLPLVFPVHPRTRKNLEAFGLWTRLADAPGIHLVDPLGYVDFMNLVCGARLAWNGGQRRQCVHGPAERRRQTGRDWV